MMHHSPTPELPRPSSRHFDCLLAAGIFASAVLVFWPVIHHGFTNWDDEANFVTNTDYRGLSSRNFAWFFTTTYMGHYQPLNWLSFAVDYCLAGSVDPGRFHRTQILLHGLASILMFLVTRRLLALSLPQKSPLTRSISAAAATLLFAIHPLRVESVAWLSARTDVLATIFLLASFQIYLSGARRLIDHRLPTGHLAAALLFYIAALLCKEMAVTLPLMFLIADIFPLGRLPSDPRLWRSAQARPVWREKLPFALVGLVAAGNAFFAADMGLAGFEHHTLTHRLAHAPVSLVFYPWKTILPTLLSPLYDFPPGFGFSHPRFIISMIALTVVAALVFAFRKKSPGACAALLAYLLFILPVSGLFQRGPQMTADRYSYIACLPLAVLFAGIIACSLSRWRYLTLLAVTAWIAALAIGTRHQIAYWKDSLTLWTRAIELEPYNGGAHANLAHAYETLGRHADAQASYELAVKLRPRHQAAWRNLAAIYNRQFRNDDAIRAYRQALVLRPDHIESRYYLAATYERIGDVASAIAEYKTVVEQQPSHVSARLALARLLVFSGYVREGEVQLRQVLQIDREQIEALDILAATCAETQRLQEALALLDLAIVIAERRGETETAHKLRESRARFAARATSQPAP